MRSAFLLFSGIALALSACGREPPNSTGSSAAAVACDERVEDCRGQMGLAATEAPFAEENFGIAAVFPAGAWVCPSFSGFTGQGYFTRVDEARFDCLDVRTPGRSAYGVRASWNAAFAPSIEAARGDRPCERDDPDERGLTLPGLQSRTCIQRTGETVLVEVEAAADRWGQGFGDEADKPKILYTAWLTTTEANRTRDLALFRRFLGQLTITPPQSG